MTVNTYRPNPTTTLDTPKKTIEQQSDIIKTKQVIPNGHRIGFVSLGCLA